MTVLVVAFQVIFWREKGWRSRYSARRLRPAVSWAGTGSSPPLSMWKPEYFQERRSASFPGLMSHSGHDSHRVFRPLHCLEGLVGKNRVLVLPVERHGDPIRFSSLRNCGSSKLICFCLRGSSSSTSFPNLIFSQSNPALQGLDGPISALAG